MNEDNGILIPTGTTLEEVEKEAILVALLHTGYNRAKASRVLGISIRTLQRKIKYHKLEVPHPLKYKKEQWQRNQREA